MVTCLPESAAVPLGRESEDIVYSCVDVRLQARPGPQSIHYIIILAKFTPRLFISVKSFSMLWAPNNGERSIRQSP
jgi:hypothetical protein